jgi:hypothetical protein
MQKIEPVARAVTYLACILEVIDSKPAQIQATILKRRLVVSLVIRHNRWVSILK